MGEYQLQSRVLAAAKALFNEIGAPFLGCLQQHWAGVVTYEQYYIGDGVRTPARSSLLPSRI